MFVVLCGRLQPKVPGGGPPRPLNPVLGKPSIYFTVRSLLSSQSVHDLLFVYGAHLRAYNFEELLSNLFPGVRCSFVCIEYATRGAVETAMCGLMQTDIDVQEPIVFVDSDNVYDQSAIDVSTQRQAFISFSSADGALDQYSFLSLQGEYVVDIAEKVPISSVISSGLYGFASRSQFEKWAHYAMQHGPRVKGETFMSSVYANMIKAGEEVRACSLPSRRIKSPEAATLFADTLDEKLRLCFELDNTLVTYASIPGDYSTVKPIQAMIDFARVSKARGHTIIIHTARRVGPNQPDSPSSASDMARITFATLDKLGIPYDEVIFGKPCADVYIDSKGINPQLQGVRTMGIPWAPANVNSIPSKLPNNKYNSLSLEGDVIAKTGPTSTITAEGKYYEAVQTCSSILHLFPTLVSPVAVSDTDSNRSTFKIGLVKGVPLTTLFSYGVLEPYHVDILMNALALLHDCTGVKVMIDQAMLMRHYMDKMRGRFHVKSLYDPYPDAPQVQQKILARLELYCLQGFQLVPVIHGDCWFANIMLTGDNEVKFLDMRGSVEGILTTNGDVVYDYAKVLQSLLGYDVTLWDLQTPPLTVQLRLLARFVERLLSLRLDPMHVYSVSVALMAGTLHAIESADARERVWRFVVSLVDAVDGTGERIALASLFKRGADLSAPMVEALPSPTAAHGASPSRAKHHCPQPEGS